MDPIPVTPRFNLDSESTFCFAFYDWERNVGSAWLEAIEEAFDAFGCLPSIGTANIDGVRKAHGRYSRVRAKLAQILSGSQQDVRVQDQASHQGEAFFPCNVRFVVSTTLSGMTQGMVAVRSSMAESLPTFIERVQGLVLARTGDTYATGFAFPAPFGPDYYLSAVGAIPRGADPSATEGYLGRATAWRDNIWRTPCRPRDGFLREVYPINFVLPPHLNQPFHASTLGAFMRDVGEVVPLSIGRMSRWVVPSSNLDHARQELESSGLVLSSSIPPRIMSSTGGS